MKLAIASWDGRVSPVLDVAKRLLVVDAEDGAAGGRHELELADSQLAARAKQISELGVEVLICGAVSWPLEAALVSSGVRVVSRVCGPVEEVLRAFLAGTLTDEAYLMPGCCGRRRRGRWRVGRGQGVTGKGRGARG